MKRREITAFGGHARRSTLRVAFAVSVAAGSVFFVAALLLLPSERVQAQASDNVQRSWSCLTSSVAAGSIFPSLATNPACGPLVIHQWPLGTGRASDVIAPPGAPTGLTASVSGATVVLNWTTSTAGGAATSYIVQAGSASGLVNLANSGTGSASPTLTATSVPAGVYFVRVLAQNASGVSAPSNEIVVTVGGGGGGCNLAPAVPTGLATAASGSTVTLSWQTPASGCAPTSYIIQAGSAPGLSNLANFSTGNAATSYSANGVGAGTYYVRVLGANAAGASGPSPDVQLVVGGGGCSGAPGASPGLSVSVSTSTVTFAWLAAPGSPTGYILQAGSSAGGSNIAVLNVGNALSYTATGVPAGTYYVRVQATGACGTGPASNEVVATVGGPGGPAGVSVTALHGFTGSPGDGSNWSTLTQGGDGNFYGTSVTGGPFSPVCSANLNGCGLIFRLSPSGAFTVLYTFTGNAADHNATPIYPYGALLQASDGNFYGTTSEGPAVYRMTPSGGVTFLTFLGGGSYGNLVQGADGNLYGTTALGGGGTCSADRSAVCLPPAGSRPCPDPGCGTVFRVTTSGGLTTLHLFTGGADGSKPYAGLVRGADGNFYGTTQAGAAGFGTVFRIGADGSFSTLHTFTGGGDGGNPQAPMIQGSDGSFYGSTVFGGAANAGTIFRITPGIAFSVLHVFTGYSVPDGVPRPGVPLDGAFPGAPLVQTGDGSLVGVTAGGGAMSGGTVFKITSAGSYGQVAIFEGNASGSSPIWLIRGSDGNFYGNCQYGGVVNKGAIFRMTPP
jgi:uncharacterized repeat protein (TIGR03803 family)